MGRVHLERIHRFGEVYVAHFTRISDVLLKHLSLKAVKPRNLKAFKRQDHLPLSMSRHPRNAEAEGRSAESRETDAAIAAADLLQKLKREHDTLPDGRRGKINFRFRCRVIPGTLRQN